MTVRIKIDQVEPSGLTKIYCRCGCIIDLDKGIVATKSKLKKKPECPRCRNARISSDIDEINSIFDGSSEYAPSC